MPFINPTGADLKKKDSLLSGIRIKTIERKKEKKGGKEAMRPQQT